MIPVLHWVATNGGFTSPLVQIFVPRIAVMYLLAIIGGTFYLTQFPESHYPGRVNFVGSSHQWWHIFVVVGFWWTHHCSVIIYQYWKDNSCPNHLILSLPTVS
jgi:predicted membrane channel-forming protein YqfA (hemolysin III family)